MCSYQKTAYKNSDFSNYVGSTRTNGFLSLTTDTRFKLEVLLPQ